MKFRIRFAEQIVGIFTLIAVGFLVVILILMGANQRWFSKDYHFKSGFSSGNGLSIGMPITLKGFQIGKVTKISLNQENEVDIEFYIFDTYYEKVTRNSVLELTSNPVGLGGGLVFHPGKSPSSPVEELSFIPSLSLPAGKALVKENLVEIPNGDDPINRIMGKTETIMDQVNEVLAKTSSVMDNMGTLMLTLENGIQGKDNGALSQTLNNVKVMTAQLNDQMTTILQNVDVTTQNVAAMTDSFKDPTGLIPKLLDAKGSLASFLDDNNALATQINSILQGIDETISQVTTFSKFINNSSPQIAGLLEETRSTLDQSQDVIEGLKNNPILRGGITQEVQQPSTFQSYRDEDF